MAQKKLKVRKTAVIVLIALLVLITIGINTLANKVREKELAATPEVTPTPLPTPTPTIAPTPEVSEATLFMVGDALLHDSLYMDGQQGDGSYDFKSMLTRIKKIASQYDLSFYNQETILGGTQLGLSSYPMFNSPQEFGRDMIDAGFNIVSTANNHSLDMGAAGVEASEAFWNKQEGIVEDGLNLSQEEQMEVKVHEVNGITYAYFAYTYGMNGLQPPSGREYLVNCYDGHMDELLAKVKKGKEIADIVIVSMHWGIEYVNEPTEQQLTLAQQLADAGADIIIGNHAHTIQPIQWLNNHKTICFYALGNFISCQLDENLIGMMAALKITKTKIGDDVTIEISDVKADLHYTYAVGAYHNDHEVIPFSQLNDNYYPGYKDVYARLSPIITAMDDSIQIGGFE